MSSAVGTVLRGVASYVQQRVDGWRTGSRGSQAFLLGVLVAMVALTALLGALVEVKVPVVMWLLFLMVGTMLLRFLPLLLLAVVLGGVAVWTSMTTQFAAASRESALVIFALALLLAIYQSSRQRSGLPMALSEAVLTQLRDRLQRQGVVPPLPNGWRTQSATITANGPSYAGDFLVADLRKYGRSLREHQTPHYVADLGEYYPELDLAWWRITQRDGHREVVASGHSTGGLTVPLWVRERRPPELLALVLNSPWFDMQGAAWLRSPAARVAIERIGTSRPMQEIPRRISDVYGRTLHRDHGGEWDYDLGWKPLESRPVYVGWLRAVRRGHARLHAGLGIACPTLVLSSARSFFGAQTDVTATTHDIVLDVEQIRRWASSVGTHVTSVAVEGAIHDVVLSRPEVRARVYDDIARWLDAWVPAAGTTHGSHEQDDQGDDADRGDHRA